MTLETEGDNYRGSKRQDTQVGVFEGNLHSQKRPERCFSVLFARTKQALFSLIQGTNAYRDDEIERMHLNMHSRPRVTRKRGSQSSQRPANASWSAPHCVHPGDSQDPKSGMVRFHDPRATAWCTWPLPSSSCRCLIGSALSR